MTRKTPPDSTASADATTHFGFKTVAEAEKETLVGEVFDSVAENYDLMNDLMSAGVHRLWKTSFVEMLRPHSNMRLLDVGGGTGDIAFRAKEAGCNDITVADINHNMLRVGRDRSLDQGLVEGLRWVTANAESLPLEDKKFDAYTIAFCLRNVTHIETALIEARRVLKPGGRFLCLEFSQVTSPALEKLYDLYSFTFLPKMGEVVAKDRGSYQYLAESIRRFPPQEKLSSMLASAGFGQVTYQNLSGGIAAIHSAWRI